VIHLAEIRTAREYMRKSQMFGEIVTNQRNARGDGS
jgi:hypothetical protein